MANKEIGYVIAKKLQNFFLSNEEDYDRDRYSAEEKLLLTDLFQSTIDNGRINFYPSDKNIGCCEDAIFVSLSSGWIKNKKSRLKSGQHLTLEEIINKVVQKVAGDCAGINRNVTIISDTFDTEVFEPWKGVFKNLIKNGVEFELLILKSNGGIMNFPIGDLLN